MNYSFENIVLKYLNVFLTNKGSYLLYNFSGWEWSLCYLKHLVIQLEKDLKKVVRLIN